MPGEPASALTSGRLRGIDDMNSILLLCSLVIPFVAALVVAALGPRRLEAIRWISLAATLLSLLCAILLAVQFVGDPPDSGSRSTSTFQPVFVPGADPANPHATTWDLITFPVSGKAPT